MMDLLKRLEKLEKKMIRVLERLGVLAAVLILLLMVIRLVLRNLFHIVIGLETICGLLLGWLATMMASEDIARRIYKSLIPKSASISWQRKTRLMVLFESLELAFSFFILVIGGFSLLYYQWQLKSSWLSLLFYSLVPLNGLLNLYFVSVNLFRIYLFVKQKGEKP